MRVVFVLSTKGSLTGAGHERTYLTLAHVQRAIASELDAVLWCVGAPAGAPATRLGGLPVEDGLLASRALSGDLDSFGHIYDRYFTRVYDFAWRTLRDDDAAASSSCRTCRSSSA